VLAQHVVVFDYENAHRLAFLPGQALRGSE
jgi:hypothetical protein